MDLSDLEIHPFIPASSLHFASHGPDPFEDPRVDAAGHGPPSSRPAGRNQWPPRTSFGQCKDWPVAQASGTASWEGKAPGSGGWFCAVSGRAGRTGFTGSSAHAQAPAAAPSKDKDKHSGEIILFTPKSGDDPDERSPPMEEYPQGCRRWIRRGVPLCSSHLQVRFSAFRARLQRCREICEICRAEASFENERPPAAESHPPRWRTRDKLLPLETRQTPLRSRSD